MWYFHIYFHFKRNVKQKLILHILNDWLFILLNFNFAYIAYIHLALHPSLESLVGDENLPYPLLPNSSPKAAFTFGMVESTLGLRAISFGSRESISDLFVRHEISACMQSCADLVFKGTDWWTVKSRWMNIYTPRQVRIVARGMSWPFLVPPSYWYFWLW